jgi:hypothetical protein
MKKYITLATIQLLLYSSIFSQGNLQFNRVINLTYNNATLKSGVYIYDTLKVPTNKVWKLESAGIKGTNTDGSSLLIDNFTVFSEVDYQTSSGVFPTPTVSSFPIWFSSGSYKLTLYCGYMSTCNNNIPASLSIIEFNVVP